MEEDRALEVAYEWGIPVINITLSDEEITKKSLEVIRSFYSTPHVEVNEPVEAL